MPDPNSVKVEPAITDGGNSGQKTGTADYANAALGISSLIKGIRNKKPKPFKPTKFTANIRPAQGNEEALQRTKNAISEQVSSAVRDVNRISGSDTQAGILARLGIQDNATKAVSQVESDNAKLYQQDLNRVSQEVNNANAINAEIENSAGAYNNQVAQVNYATNQAAAAAGVQSALQYQADKEADLENKRVAETQYNQQLEAMDSTHWQTAYDENFRITGDASKAKAYADDKMRQRNFSRLKSNNYSANRSWYSGLFGKRKSAPISSTGNQ